MNECKAIYIAYSVFTTINYFLFLTILFSCFTACIYLIFSIFTSNTITLRIKNHVRLQIVGWSIYWLLLLTINILYFNDKNYGQPLLIVWTILFTISGIALFYLQTRIFNLLINKKVNILLFIPILIILSFITAYLWGLMEPTISWLINPKIKDLNIACDINSRRTFSQTFVVAFFSMLYYFSKQQIVIKNTSTDNTSTNTTPTQFNDSETITAYHKNEIVLLPVHMIKKISINGNYSSITDINNVKYDQKKSLAKWEITLPPTVFLRIHRSTIINIKCIDKIEPGHNYSYKITLCNSKNTEEVSRRYAKIFRIKMNL